MQQNCWRGGDLLEEETQLGYLMSDVEEVQGGGLCTVGVHGGSGQCLCAVLYPQSFEALCFRLRLTKVFE